MMQENDLDTLNTVQQVLRGLMASLMAATDADPAKLALGLQAFAGHPGISPMAQQMLLDLAEYPDALIKANGDRPS